MESFNKISMKGALGRAQNVFAVAKDDRVLPWTLKEIWDPQVAHAANELRQCAQDLMAKKTGVSDFFIANTLGVPPYMFPAGAGLIFRDVIAKPTPENIRDGKQKLHDEVRLMSEVIADISFL